MRLEKIHRNKEHTGSKRKSLQIEDFNKVENLVNLKLLQTPQSPSSIRLKFTMNSLFFFQIKKYLYM